MAPQELHPRFISSLHIHPRQEKGWVWFWDLSFQRRLGVPWLSRLTGTPCRNPDNGFLCLLGTQQPCRGAEVPLFLSQGVSIVFPDS